MITSGGARKAHSPDYGLLGLVLLLSLFGLTMLYSISPVVSRNFFGSEVSRNYFFNNQIQNFLLGLVLCGIAYKIHYRFWRSIAVPSLIVAVILMFAVFIPGLGIELGGATRWLNLGIASIQPAEIMKLVMVAYLALWLEQKGKWIRTFKNGLFPFCILVGSLGIVVAVLQRDLGTMIILGGSMIAMYFVAGAPIHHFVLLGFAGLASLAGLIVTFPHRISRVTTFLNPMSDPQGQGYHILQVLIGLGSGGLFGRGLGKSVQLYGYVPAPPTDSIFAIVGEELGLVGASALIILFVVLARKGFKISRDAPDTFGRLFAAGITANLILQMIVNIAAMLALIPLTGVPLPFISYGGSSLVASLVSVGILANISKYSVEVKNASRSFRWWHRWTRLANIGSRYRTKTQSA